MKTNMLKRSTFRTQSLEEIKEKQAIKRERLLSAKKSVKAPVKSVLGRSQGVKRVVKKKSELMPARIKRAKAKLEKISHDFVRRRDSKTFDRFAGNCIDCGLWAEDGQFQSGHFESSGGNGAWLRYHPHNMHGQSGGCNMARSQEKVKIAYTLKMIDMYGREYVDYLRSYKTIEIKADLYYYECLYNMYANGTEEEICSWLDNYGKNNRLN